MYSKLEQQFLELWQEQSDLPLEREFQAIPGRRYRFDFFCRPANTLVEINGGTWGKGGHSTGKGIQRDCEKANAAELEGYHLFVLTKEMITTEYVQLIANACATFVTGTLAAPGFESLG